MKAVFLDAESLGKNFPLDPLKTLPCEWTFYPITHANEVLERAANCEILVTNKVKLTREILAQLPALKLICLSATGFDNIDIHAASEFGITVCNVPAYSTPSVVQLTILLMLALFHNLIPYHQAVSQGAWQKHPFSSILDFPIVEVQGKTLGILGYGKLGQGVAEVAKAFGMKVLVASRKEGLQLVELLPQVDVLTLHLPLNASTRNTISAKEIALMKPSSFLINVARGGLVNEVDLANALKEKRLAGAAVDVLSNEPPKEGNPLLQPDIPNLIVTPHIAWGSVESRKRVVLGLRDNILAFTSGKPQNVVN